MSESISRRWTGFCLNFDFHFTQAKTDKGEEEVEHEANELIKAEDETVELDLKMKSNLLKDEKEKALDARIAAIRAKNEKLVQRQKEVEEDRRVAERRNQSVTTQPKVKVDKELEYVGEERESRGGKKGRRRGRGHTMFKAQLLLETLLERGKERGVGGLLQNITCMDEYRAFSQEELRYEEYLRLGRLKEFTSPSSQTLISEVCSIEEGAKREIGSAYKNDNFKLSVSAEDGGVKAEVKNIIIEEKTLLKNNSIVGDAKKNNENTTKLSIKEQAEVETIFLENTSGNSATLKPVPLRRPHSIPSITPYLKKKPR